MGTQDLTAKIADLESPAFLERCRMGVGVLHLQLIMKSNSSSPGFPMAFAQLLEDTCNRAFGQITRKQEPLYMSFFSIDLMASYNCQLEALPTHGAFQLYVKCTPKPYFCCCAYSKANSSCLQGTCSLRKNLQESFLQKAY
jgi:hypothetical protein